MSDILRYGPGDETRANPTVKAMKAVAEKLALYTARVLKNIPAATAAFAILPTGAVDTTLFTPHSAIVSEGALIQLPWDTQPNTRRISEGNSGVESSNKNPYCGMTWEIKYDAHKHEQTGVAYIEGPGEYSIDVQGAEGGAVLRYFSQVGLKDPAPFKLNGDTPSPNKPWGWLKPPHEDYESWSPFPANGSYPDDLVVYTEEAVVIYPFLNNMFENAEYAVTVTCPEVKASD